jgi:type IV pilus assembly protein PilF
VNMKTTRDRRGLQLALPGLVAGVLTLSACVSEHPMHKQDAANYNVQLGIGYMNQGNLPVAKDKLDKALEENPHLAAVHTARALLFDRLNKPKEADEEFREALRLGGDDPNIQNSYAVYLCRIGRTDEGVKLFQTVAANRLYRTPEIAYTNAGVCLRADKRYQPAAEAFERAVAVRPGYAEGVFQLVELYFMQGKLVDARAQLDKYLGSFDATPDLLFVGVRVTRAQGDQVAAARLSRKLRVDFPSSDQARRLSELDHNPG